MHYERKEKRVITCGWHECRKTVTVINRASDPIPKGCSRVCSAKITKAAKKGTESGTITAECLYCFKPVQRSTCGGRPRLFCKGRTCGKAYYKDVGKGLAPKTCSMDANDDHVDYSHLKRELFGRKWIVRTPEGKCITVPA